MRTETEIICDRCGRMSKIDKAADQGYLQSQYGWDCVAGVRCPMCRYGTAKGSKLLSEMEEVRQKRQQAGSKGRDWANK